jgi:S1-C subfamily serine protease
VLGNPHGFRRVYREGIVAAANELPECPEFTPTITQRKGCVVLLFQMSLGQGDSGAGYFDDKGRLVAVHSAAAPIAIADEDDWYATLPMALPLAFTDEQWRVAGV